MKVAIKTLKRQISEFKSNGYKHIWIEYLIQMISVGVISYITVRVSKTVIDLFIDENLRQTFMYIGAYMLILCIAVFGRIYTDAKVSSIFLKIRLIQYERYYDKYLKIDYIYLEDADFHKKIEPSIYALSSDQHGFQYTYTLSFELISFLVSALIYLIVLTKFNYHISLACLFSMMINYFIYSKISQIDYKEKERISEKRRKTSYFYNTAYDFSYGKDIRLYNLDDHLINTYEKESKGLLSIYRNIKRKATALSLLDIIAIIVRNGLAYYLIIDAYFNHQIEISSVMMLLTATTLLTESLNEIGIRFGKLNESLRHTTDYYHYLDSMDITYEKGIDKVLKENIKIKLVNVSFRYPGTQSYILENINLEIDAKSKIAIVGENGSGKTTLIKLICGLLRPTEGQIFINEIDSALFSQEAYYQMFAMVFQDTTVFSGTILENVMGARKDDMKRAKYALEKVGLKSKIESLASGYHQPLLKVIYPNGIDLSGGERQKLNIARALYKNAPVVILDEPTASLDALAEEKIYVDFNEVSKDKTAIFISHRLSSTKFCDNIILLTKEGIKEAGTHEHLIEKKGLYYQMFQVQGKYYQEVEI